MDKNLFQNDHITGNSNIGFDFRGQFKDDENVLIEKLKGILNREVAFSNIDYKLLEPTDTQAVLIKDGTFYEVKTPQYTYFEAIFILPKVFDFLKGLKDYKNSYFYFRLGFNGEFCNLAHLNVTKFALEFNEDYILKHIIDSTKDGSLEKLTDIKPQNLEMCSDSIQKQLDVLKFESEDIYGITFDTLNLGYITFKYAQDINYRNKWEEIMKCLNHTIITLYNSAINPNFTDEESKKLDDMNKSYEDVIKAFGCYELFKEKYSKIKLTKDLDNDTATIEMIFPSIKDKLFDIVVRNGIKEAQINYDSDVSRLQLKDLELNKCYHLSGIDIVDGELTNCNIKECEIYDTNIEKCTVIKCNLFGYSDNKESKFKDCFISRNIQLKDCIVTGSLGKMGGIMKGGSLRNTTIISSMADIDDKVEKINVNEVQ